MSWIVKYDWMQLRWLSWVIKAVLSRRSRLGIKHSNLAIFRSFRNTFCRLCTLRKTSLTSRRKRCVTQRSKCERSEQGITNILSRTFLVTLRRGYVHLNLIEILGSLKRDWKGEKRLWNTTRQLPDPTMAPQVFGQLFGVYLPIFNFKL